MLAIALAVVVGGGFIAFFALRGGKTSHAATAPAPPQTAPVADQTAPAPPVPPQQAVSAPPPVSSTHAPKPGELAAALQNTLERLELWSTVAVTGTRVDLQSGSCRDPQLEKQLAATAAAFKASGLTRVRCVEQSGAVVFDREL